MARLVDRDDLTLLGRGVILLFSLLILALILGLAVRIFMLAAFG
jgi:hypothetical protein